MILRGLAQANRRFARRERAAELTRGPSLSQDGAIAQLGERVLCKHEVVGSIPSGSTRL